MSEVLRDLVVSLSLDGDNFSRNLTSINKQIQEAESEFKRAASGVDSFEKSVSGTQSQLSSLQQKMALQQKAVKQYERALEAANKKLENAYARQGKLTESLDAARQKNADLKQQVAAATKQYERFSRELGESDSATLAAKANLDALSQEYAESSAEVKKLEGQLAANTKSLQNNADAVTKARTNLNNAQGALRQTEQQIRTTTERLARMQSAWTKAGDTLTAFGKKCASVSASMEKLGKGMTTTLTTPVLALGTTAIKASVEYESAFTSVRKTVDATEAEYENAVKAAAEGMGAINTQLAEQYDKEFALIQLISDETERQQALDQLNAKYNNDRLAAAQQYAQTLASVIMPVWQQEDIQGAAADIDTLTQKLREYSAADESEKPGILEDLNEITAAMDEGAVTEYIALLMQVQSLLDSGMTQAEVQSLFPELDFSGAMDQIAAIQTFLSDRKNLLPGLESMFSEAIPDEVLKIATDLDMTGAQARWDEFAQNPGAITTEAIISGYGQQEGVEPPKLETVITISGYDLTAYRQFLADNPIEVEGVLRLSEVFQNPEDAPKAENVTFWQNGVEIPASLVPKELLTPDKVAVLDEDGTMHILITPKIEGTAESVSAAGEKLDTSFVTTSVFGKTSQHDWGALNGLLGGSLIDWMHSFTAELKAFDNYKGSWATLCVGPAG